MTYVMPLILVLLMTWALLGGYFLALRPKWAQNAGAICAIIGMLFGFSAPSLFEATVVLIVYAVPILVYGIGMALRHLVDRDPVSGLVVGLLLLVFGVVIFWGMYKDSGVARVALVFPLIMLFFAFPLLGEYILQQGRGRFAYRPQVRHHRNPDRVDDPIE